MKIKPKKSLGQNFLVDQEIIRKIIAGADLKSDDVVLEIGPGKGILTEALASQCRKVIAVEIDNNLVELLKVKFKNNPRVDIMHKDILKISNFEFLISNQIPISNSQIFEKDTKKLKAESYKLIANLPYYITSPIIRKFLESETPPQEMILMVQKEVAERIVASPSEIPSEARDAKRISLGKPGKMSILAVSVQYYASAEILFYVSKSSFDPVPEVDSAVIKISNLKSQIPNLERERFFRIVRAGFCAKRKMLSNNLSNSFHLEKGVVENKLAEAGLALNIRAQELSVEDWKRLCATMEV